MATDDGEIPKNFMNLVDSLAKKDTEKISKYWNILEGQRIKHDEVFAELDKMRIAHKRSKLRSQSSKIKKFVVQKRQVENNMDDSAEAQILMTKDGIMNATADLKNAYKKIVHLKRMIPKKNEDIGSPVIPKMGEDIVSLKKNRVSSLGSQSANTERTLSEVGESQLWADLKHMQTAVFLSSPKLYDQTERTRLIPTIGYEESSEPLHPYEPFPETSSSIRRSTYRFSARSPFSKALANVTTRRMAFKFTKKQRRVPEELIRRMKIYKEPNSKMLYF